MENEETRTLGDDLDLINESDSWLLGEIPKVVSADRTVDILFGLTFREPDMDALSGQGIFLMDKEGCLYTPASLAGEDESVLVQYGIFPEGPIADILDMLRQAESDVVQYNLGGDVLWAISLEKTKEISEDLNLSETAFAISETTADLVFGEASPVSEDQE